MEKPVIRRCPVCNSTYTNDSFRFCLDDGTPLVVDTSTQFDPHAKTLLLDARLPQSNQPKVIKRQFHDELGKREIAYPQVQGLRSEYIQRRVNSCLRTKFLALDRPPTNEEDSPDYREFTGYGVTLLTPETLSTKLWSSIDFGGAHPVNELEAFNLDLRNGYKYTYEDLFRLESDYKTIIPEMMTTSLQKQSRKESFVYLSPEPKEQYEFYLTRRNLVIFNLYTQHAVQSLEVPIKLSDISDLVHREGPLFSLLN